MITIAQDTAETSLKKGSFCLIKRQIIHASKQACPVWTADKNTIEKEENAKSIKTAKTSNFFIITAYHNLSCLSMLRIIAVKLLK